jgi:GMP synthase (glutamine-hydrolysing)
MVPTILVLQFRTNLVAADLEKKSVVRELADQATVTFVSALDSEVDWLHPEKLLQSYQGLILGGSGDFDFDGGRRTDDRARQTTIELLSRLTPLLTYVFASDFPTLGICFGHQLLGAFSGVNVVHDSTQMKIRSHLISRIDLDAEAGIFTDMPTDFLAHYVHKDTLDRVPDGAQLLACGGSACQVSALRYRRNIYSTQFHPELTFTDVLQRVDVFPGYLRAGDTVAAVFTPAGDCTTLIRNFIVQVALVASVTNDAERL